jgi:iron complex outermembrane receptor protein
VYAVNRGSWRAGNFNWTEPPEGNANAFLPEKTYDFELGFKYSGQVLGKSASANLAVFEQVVKDVQRDVYVTIDGSPASVTGNVKRAEIQGVELDFNLKATSWLQIGTAGSHEFAHFTEPTAEVFGTAYTFSSYADTPRYSGSVYGSVELPAPKSYGNMLVRADMYAQKLAVFLKPLWLRHSGYAPTGLCAAQLPV